MTEHGSSPGRRTRTWTWLLLAALLWLAGALHRSLWVDEFHVLHHLRQDGLGATLASLRTDNHPPLGFLLIGLSRQLLGEGELALRLPGMLAGLVFLYHVALLGRRFDAPAAPALVAAASYTFLLATEARMYPLLALAATSLLLALVELLDGRASRVPHWLRIAYWTAIGLHAHYYFGHVLIALGLASLVLALRDPAARPNLRRALGAIALGGLVALPWYLWALPHQLGHGLPTGGQHGALADLPRGYGHLFFIHASLAGDWASRWLALPGVGVALAALGLGLVRLARGSQPADDATGARLSDRGPVLLLLGLGLGLPLLAWCISQAFPRASYGWRYLAGAAGPVYVIAAAGLRTRPGRLIAPLLFALLGAVTAINLASPGTEDYRGATRYVLEHARPGDVVLLKGLWSQDQEHSLTGWDYYAERLGEGSLSSAGAVPRTVRVEQYRAVLEAPRVWVLARYRYPSAVLDALEAHFGPPRFERISQALSVRLYSEGAAPEPGPAPPPPPPGRTASEK